MRTILICICILLYSFEAFSQADSTFSGIISVDTTITGELDINSDITINSGVTLTIQPGTILNVMGNFGITVNGAIHAVGEDTSKITIKSSDGNPTSGDWKGISFTSQSGFPVTSIKNVEIHHAVTGITLNSIPSAYSLNFDAVKIKDVSNDGIRINNSHTTINNISILNYGSDGIFVEGSNSEVTVTDSEIDQQSSSLVRTGNGVFVHNRADLELTGNTITRANNGVYVRNYTSSSNVPPTISASDNQILSNNIGVYVYGGSSGQDYPSVEFTGNDIHGNINWNINLTSGRDPANTLLNFTNNWWGTTDAVEIAATIYDASFTTSRAYVDYLPMRNVSKADSNGVSTSLNYKAGWVTEEGTWTGDDIIVSGRVVIRDGGSLNIVAGTEIEFGPRGYLDALSKLTVSGEEGSPVMMRGYGSNPAVGSWSGVNLNGAGSEASSIRYLKLSDATTGLRVSGTGLNALEPINLVGLEVTNTSSHGITMSNSRVELTGADLEDIGEDGVVITNSEVTASGVNILNYGSDGIFVEGSNSEVTVTDSEIDQQSSSLVRTGNGVFVHNRADLELTGNRITRCSVGVYVFNNYISNNSGNYPPIVVAAGNEIIQNSDGVRVTGRRVSYSPSSPVDYPLVDFTGNDIYGNVDWNVNLETGTNPSSTLLNFTNNWWGTVEREEIDALIYDFNDATNRATVSYRPFLTETSDVRGVADINKDGRADGFDLSILASSFGLSEGNTGYKTAADIYSDSRIDGFDLAILGIHFGEYGSGGIMGKMNTKNDSVFVSLTPDKSFITKGDTVTYSFEAKDAPALYAIATTLNYDSRLKVIDVLDSGFLATEKDYQTSFLNINNTDKKQLTIGLTRLNGEENKFATGDGKILSISFVAEADISGDFELEIESIGLFSPTGLQYSIANNGVATSIEQTSEIPEDFTLHQNYPNPFNPSTNIQFEIPEASNVILRVYDILGREISTLVNGKMNAGIHSITFDASSLSSGVYLYQIQAGKIFVTKKMILLK